MSKWFLWFLKVVRKDKISKAFKVRLRLFLENLGDCCGGCCLFFGVGVKIFFAFLLRCKKIIVDCHLSIINLLLSLLHLRADALILCWRLGWLGGDNIVERRLLGALVLTFRNFANYRIPFVIYWNTIYYKWYFISRNKTETKVLKNHILMFFMFLLFVFPSFDFILLSWWKIFKYCRGTKFVSSRKHLFLLTYFFFLIIHWLFCFQLQR